MLLGDLYILNSLQTQENNTILVKMELNPNHAIFRGHFPQHPVMPGVCLTNMITDALSSFLKNDYYLSSADYIKFIQLVIPGKTNEVSVIIKFLSNETELIRIEATVSDENTIYLKLRGSFRPKMF
jgi:3-hydroxyacyl-[acyl-carrier-protein] dehydratase